MAIGTTLSCLNNTSLVQTIYAQALSAAMPVPVVWLTSVHAPHRGAGGWPAGRVLSIWVRAAAVSPVARQ